MKLTVDRGSFKEFSSSAIFLDTSVLRFSVKEISSYCSLTLLFYVLASKKSFTLQFISRSFQDILAQPPMLPLCLLLQMLLCAA